MIENLEFWGLLISIFVGFISLFCMMLDIRSKICENAERITRLETETHLEFAKCRLHTCNGRNE